MFQRMQWAHHDNHMLCNLCSLERVMVASVGNENATHVSQLNRYSGSETENRNDYLLIEKLVQISRDICFFVSYERQATQAHKNGNMEDSHLSIRFGNCEHFHAIDPINFCWCYDLVVHWTVRIQRTILLTLLLVSIMFEPAFEERMIQTVFW